MRTKINWQESIKQNSLIFTSSPLKSRTKDSLGRLLIVGTLALSLLVFLNNQWSDNVGGIIVIAFVSVFFFVWFSQHSQHYLALTRVSGISPEENQKILHKVLDELQWRIVEDNKHYLICSPSVSLFSAERQITILYDGNDILINSLTFARAGNIAPFSTKGNASRMDKIASRFENLCTNKRNHGKRHA